MSFGLGFGRLSDEMKFSGDKKLHVNASWAVLSFSDHLKTYNA